MIRHAVVYVFGLSDHRAKGQTLAVQAWQAYGVRSEVFHMYWHVATPLAQKMHQLLERIDSLADEGYLVSLVGTSAGASVAVSAYAARPTTIHAVVCICGKLRNPETIHPATYRANPAFQESLAQLPSRITALTPEQKGRILSIRPLSDKLVPPHDTIIPGAQSGRLYTVGHAFTIGYGITIYAPFLLRFIRGLKTNTLH